MLCLCTLVFRKSNLIGRERWRLQRSEISYLMERETLANLQSTLILRIALNSLTNLRRSRCLDVVKEAKVLEREALSVTGKSFVTTSKVSRSPPSVDWLAEVESSESADSSTKRPEVSSRSSWRTWSGMLSPTPSTPRGRRLPPWTSSMPWNAKDVPCTDSEVKEISYLSTKGSFNCHTSLKQTWLKPIYLGFEKRASFAAVSFSYFSMYGSL